MKIVLLILFTLILSLSITPLVFAEKECPLLGTPGIISNIDDFKKNGDIEIILNFKNITFVTENECGESETFMSIYYEDVSTKQSVNVDMSKVVISPIGKYDIDVNHNRSEFNQSQLVLKIKNVKELDHNDMVSVKFILSSPEITFDVGYDDEYVIQMGSNTSGSLSRTLLEFNELRDIPKITLKKQNTIDAMREPLDKSKTMQYYMDRYNDENDTSFNEWFDKIMFEVVENNSYRNEITIYELLGIPKEIQKPTIEILEKTKEVKQPIELEIIKEKHKTCPSRSIPVCGVNGETYNNQCFLDGNDILLDYEGECKVEPIIKQQNQDIVVEPIPEPIEERKCGDGTILVDGFCKVIIPSKEPTESVDFMKWFFNLFK